MDAIRRVVLEAGDALTTLLADERVVRRWSEPSALPMLSIGGLAGHLVRALETIETYLDEPEPPDEDLLTAGAYFARGLDANPDLDAPTHRGIRERGEQAASVGPATLLAEHVARLDRLAARLDSESPERRVTVMRGAARMTLDQYLPTRIVEIVVHVDDLATSVGMEARQPRAATSIAIDVLVSTAVQRHGDLAVLRALTRRERDDVGALRVL